MKFQKGHKLGVGNSYSRTHGMAGTPTYRSWRSMSSRCSNPNSDGWEDYGGRGISVCERWGSFEKFFEDMGERPAGKTLDRFPNCAGNYEPGNCRWATLEEQQNNQNHIRKITLGDTTLSYAQWSRRLGLSDGTVSHRIGRGWSPERAVSVGA